MRALSGNGVIWILGHVFIAMKFCNEVKLSSKGFYDSSAYKLNNFLRKFIAKCNLTQLTNQTHQKFHQGSNKNLPREAKYKSRKASSNKRRLKSN